MSDLLNDMVRSVQASAEQHILTLEIQPPETEIIADRVRLEQVIGNILDNAIKYSPHGGQVNIRLQKQSDNIYHVSVKDQGIGVYPANISNTFLSVFIASKVNRPASITQASDLDSMLLKRLSTDMEGISGWKTIRATGINLPLYRANGNATRKTREIIPLDRVADVLAQVCHGFGTQAKKHVHITHNRSNHVRYCRCVPCAQYFSVKNLASSISSPGGLNNSEGVPRATRSRTKKLHQSVYIT